MKKYFLLLFALTLFITHSRAQEFDMGAYSTFKEAKEAFYKMAETTDMTTVKGYKQFKRREWYMNQRTYPNYEPINYLAQWNEVHNYNTQMDIRASTNGNWTSLGPLVLPLDGGFSKGGAGRVNKITLDPINPEIVWVCAASGGLWKSPNGGNTWSTNTDLLSTIGYSDLAINYQNTDIMYLGTGDAYATDAYSVGILKSIDGGLTWNTTGFTLDNTVFNDVYAIAMSPTDPNILVIGTNTGVWRSTDGAANWTHVFSLSAIKDVKFKPGDGSTVYASGAEVYRSTDGGVTFAQSSTTLNANHITLSVSAAVPNMVYAYAVQNILWKSSDEGQTFGQGIPLNNHFTSWAHELEVSPYDTSVIGISGFQFYLSKDGGLTKYVSGNGSTTATTNYAHVDHRAITWHPTDSLIMYIGSDGGAYRSDDGGIGWTDISSGLVITQYYKIGLSQLNSDIVIGGSQDNGTTLFDGNNWVTQRSGDGMECIVDYTNENILYASSQNGRLYHSSDGGATYANITPPNSTGPWVTNFVQHPTNHTSIYYGGDELYRSTNAGVTWSEITNGVTSGSHIYDIKVCPADTQVIYFRTINKIYKTSDNGANWADITGTIGAFTGTVSSIEVDNTDPNHVWATSNLFNNSKVWESVDGGATWNEISGTLPNIYRNCLTHDKTTENGIYLGTDFGVYFKNDTMADWIPFMNDLPNVSVTEMEIHTGDNKIVAGTYGRGMWASDLYSQPVVILKRIVLKYKCNYFPTQQAQHLLLVLMLRL